MNRTFLFRAGSGAAALLCVLLLSACSGAGEVPPVSATEATAPRIAVGTVSCPPDASALTVADADPAQLEQALPLLPLLRELTLEGTLPPADFLLTLQENYPSLTLHYTVSIGETGYPNDTEILDLTGVPVKAEQLKQALPLLTELQEVHLKDSGLSEAECRALADLQPQTFFLFDLSFAGQTFSTDAAQIDVSGIPVTVEETEEALGYLCRLEKLIMTDCGIDNDTMDALNLRYPDTKVVWTVMIGMLPVRTDEIYFYPVVRGYMPNDADLQNLRYCRDMIAIDIGHICSLNCEWLRNMPHLQYLILVDSGMQDLSPLSDLKELIYLELFDMNIKDYSPLLECTSLQALNISATSGDPEPISKMTWLHTLMWCGAANNPHIREEASKLPEQLPDTIVVLEGGYNLAEPWRYIPHYYVFRDIIGGSFLNQNLTVHYYGEDTERLLACDRSEEFAGDVLAEIVKDRMDKGLPIPGIKNVGSEKAQILYDYLLHCKP